MPQPTTPVDDAIDLTTLRTLDDHPLCRPLHREKLALLTRQRTVQESLDAARAVLRTAEHEHPAQWRRARQQAAADEEELDDIRTALREVQEKLETAQSAARATLRPLLAHDTVPVLEHAEQAMLTLLQIQDELQALDARARRLGISMNLGRFVDPTLAWRVTALQERIATLAREARPQLRKG